MTKHAGQSSEPNPDAPLSRSDDDRLNRAPFAHAIADMLIARTDATSLVVGIEGAWGEGKSSVLNFIEQRIQSECVDNRFTVVRFSPWIAQGYHGLVASFFESLVRAIDDLPHGTRKLADRLRRYGSAIAKVASAAQVVPGAAFLGETVNVVGAGVDALAKKRADDALDAFLEQEGGGRGLVFIIDDVDRLDREGAHALFKLMKVAADFRHVTYVIAYDREIVSKLLSESYGGTQSDGERYLEKVVQLPLPLPRITEETLLRFVCEAAERQLQLVNGSLETLGDDERRRFFRVLEAIAPTIGTRRAVIRFENALLLSLKMSQAELCTGHLLAVEALRVFSPQLHRFISENTHLLFHKLETHLDTDDSQRHKEWKDRLEAVLPISDQRRSQAEKALSALFPQAGEALGGSGHADSFLVEWAQDKRICSPTHFPRYFAYGAISHRVSESEVDAFFTEELPKVSGSRKTTMENLLQRIGTRNALLELDSGLERCVKGSAIEKKQRSRDGFSWLTDYLLSIADSWSTIPMPGAEGLGRHSSEVSAGVGLLLSLASELARLSEASDRAEAECGPLERGVSECSMVVATALVREATSPLLPSGVSSNLQRQTDEAQKLYEQRALKEVAGMLRNPSGWGSWALKHLERHRDDDLASSLRELSRSNPDIPIDYLKVRIPSYWSHGLVHEGSHQAGEFREAIGPQLKAFLIENLTERIPRQQGEEFEDQGKATDSDASRDRERVLKIIEVLEENAE